MSVLTANRRDQLLCILRESALMELPEPIKLASGAWSSHFIDGKKALAKWSDLRVACEAIVEEVTNAGHGFDAVGGLTLGADAIAVGVAAVSDTKWFFIRKEPKKRGTRRLIEGACLGKDDRVLLVDDVVTTGGSIFKALEAIEETEATVAAAVTLVDRGDSAGPRFAEKGIVYIPMANYEDLSIEPVRFG